MNACFGYAFSRQTVEVENVKSKNGENWKRAVENKEIISVDKLDS